MADAKVAAFMAACKVDPADPMIKARHAFTRRLVARCKGTPSRPDRNDLSAVMWSVFSELDRLIVSLRAIGLRDDVIAHILSGEKLK